MVISIEVDPIEKVLKGQKNWLLEFDIRGWIDAIQARALLKSAQILRVLWIFRWFTVWKPIAKTGVKSHKKYTHTHAHTHIHTHTHTQTYIYIYIYIYIYKRYHKMKIISYTNIFTILKLIRKKIRTCVVSLLYLILGMRVCMLKLSR